MVAPTGRNDAIRRRIIDGEPLRQIASDYALTMRQLAQIATQPRSRAGSMQIAYAARSAYVKGRDAEIRRRVKAKDPATQIARDLGISEGTVRYVAARDGLYVPRPTKPKAPVERGMSLSDAHAYLERAVARECAPPWERHPQPIS